LIVWLVGGLLSLIQVGDEQRTSNISERRSIWRSPRSCSPACSATEILSRLAILRRAYILAALIATAAGYIGFFHLLPGSDIFWNEGRVSATFKDPNVYGPFLIFPLLLLMIGLMTRGIRLSTSSPSQCCWAVLL
jgi:hypothetical protein